MGQKHEDIPIWNLYYMLSYAFRDLDWDNYKNAKAEEFENAYDFFSWWLAKEIERQRRRGLHREYINHEEDLVSPHGKINMPGTIKNRLARKQALACEYDELSENNLLNQILKTTSLRLIGCAAVGRKNKAVLRREMLFFSNVDTTDLKRVRWANLHYQRGNKFYRDLIGICRFILEGSPGNDKSGAKMDHFNPDNMPALYEKFILGYYKKEHPELEVGNPEIKWAGVSDDEMGMLPKMRTDILLRKDNNILIIDAKFYAQNIQDRYESEKIISENLYQIFAYVKNKDADPKLKEVPHKVSGMLLYAATNKETQPNQPKGNWTICGNQISVKALDLNCKFDEIRKQLDKIAIVNFGGDILKDMP